MFRNQKTIKRYFKMKIALTVYIYSVLVSILIIQLIKHESKRVQKPLTATNKALYTVAFMPVANTVTSLLFIVVLLKGFINGYRRDK